MPEDYHISVDKLIEFIDAFSDELKTYGNFNLVLNSDSDDSYTEHYTKILLKRPFNKLQLLQMNLGAKSLIENVNCDMVRDEDVVIFVWSFYHEMTHVQNHMRDYVDKCVDNDIKQAAAVEVIADYMPDFRYYAEKYFPSELKSECNAFVMTEEFFENIDIKIDYKSIILNRINSDDYQFLQRNVDSYDMIYDCLLDRYHKSFYDLRLGMLWNYPVKSKEAKNFINSPEMTSKIVDNPTNGLEETEIAMTYILKHHPSQLGAYKCLHKDYFLSGFYRLKKLFDRDLPNIDYNDEMDEEDECNRD